MPNKECQNPNCKKDFYSKHSTARFCSRVCSGRSNAERYSLERRNQDSDDELLQKIVLLAEKLNKTPSKRDVDSSRETPSARLYQARFGSWNRALELAGFKPSQHSSPRTHDGSEIKLSLRFSVLARDNFSCVYCGGRPEDGYILHADHKVPKSKGGSTTMDNLVTSCSSCNLGKSDTLI